MTDLGIMEINKLSSKSSQAAITRIPWTSVGFPLIQSLVDILCESCLSQSDRDRTFTDTTWLQILELLQLCQGPLVNRSTQNPLGK